MLLEVDALEVDVLEFGALEFGALEFVVFAVLVGTKIEEGVAIGVGVVGVIGFTGDGMSGLPRSANGVTGV